MLSDSERLYILIVQYGLARVLGLFFYVTLCADSRSRRARAPWLVRSSDIFCPAVASSAQA